MTTAPYERYGLTGNPFRDLAAETVEDIALVHVNQEVDEILRTIREEILERENKAVVAITGALGAGKTERLLLAAADCRERGAFTVYFDVSNRNEYMLKGLAAEIHKSASSAKLSKGLGTPSWLRGISELEKLKEARYDPKAAGKSLAAPFNEHTPAVLLLNDVHNLVETREVDAFADVMQEMIDAIRPGVLIMFSAFSSYIAWLRVNHPALASRINRIFQLTGLSDVEARLILAKKMLAKRVVEDLDPTFPFDVDAVRALNRASGGNPRRLLEMADLALEYGVAHRSYHIDAGVVSLVFAQPTPSRGAAEGVEVAGKDPTPGASAGTVGAPGTRPVSTATWSETK